MCFLYTREEDVCSQDNFPTRCVFSIPVRKMSALRTLPHEMCFLYTREEVVCSQDNFPTRCVFSIAVRQLSDDPVKLSLGSDLKTTSPREMVSL